MASDRSPPPDNAGRILPFRPRRGRPWPWGRLRGAPVRDLAKYERSGPDDDYRHRMLMNLLGLAVTVLLVVAGIWIADKIAELRKTQDCYVSGRRNCAPVEAPPMQRD